MPSPGRRPRAALRTLLLGALLGAAGCVETLTVRSHGVGGYPFTTPGTDDWHAQPLAREAVARAARELAARAPRTARTQRIFLDLPVRSYPGDRPHFDPGAGELVRAELDAAFPGPVSTEAEWAMYTVTALVCPGPQPGRFALLLELWGTGANLATALIQLEDGP